MTWSSAVSPIRIPYTHGAAHGRPDSKPPSPISAISGNGVGCGDSRTGTGGEVSVVGAAHETRSRRDNIETAIFLIMIRSPRSKSISFTIGWKYAVHSFP